jgi:hypothetical protein
MNKSLACRPRRGFRWRLRSPREFVAPPQLLSLPCPPLLFSDRGCLSCLSNLPLFILPRDQAPPPTRKQTPPLSFSLNFELLLRYYLLPVLLSRISAINADEFLNVSLPFLPRDALCPKISRFLTPPIFGNWSRPSTGSKLRTQANDVTFEFARLQVG